MLILWLGFGMVSAQTPFEVKNVEMTIDGTSSLHDWTSEVTEVNAEGALDLSGGDLKAIKGLTVTVPVTSIKSSKGNIMDKKTYDAFDSEQHPNITYVLKDVQSISNNGSTYTVKTKGDLTMAGTTKSIEMTVSGELTGNGDIRFQGSKALDMTEWNMEPPTAMFGTLKTGKDITVNFALTLGTTKS
jgi:polyisoprenoid-binding protein YceI